MERRSANGAALAPAASATYERFAGGCAVAAGVVGILYAIAVLGLRNALLSGLFLMTGALLSSAAVVAVYGRLRRTDEGFALLALLLGLAGALGSAVHGGYDLAVAIDRGGPVDGLPNPVDPRGLLTFGAAGLAALIVGWLILRGAQFPRGLGYLGLVLGVLLLILYLTTLTIADARNPLVALPAAATGLVVNPAWYLWLGATLWRGPGSTGELGTR